jgi:hypothetical protein
VTEFYAAFRRVKESVATFRANKIVASSLRLESISAQEELRFEAENKTALYAGDGI